ncbi:hypothetical protein AGDE_16624 [Angomonas deanei]|nr:hypothetical protein AGDE_16624 [Angomonas deanei]|eukprot:EPY16758.1 hypothetical protein AGDE_16624 [Angomonas deanei]
MIAILTRKPIQKPQKQESGEILAEQNENEESTPTSRSNHYCCCGSEVGDGSVIEDGSAGEGSNHRRHSPYRDGNTHRPVVGNGGSGVGGCTRSVLPVCRTVWRSLFHRRPRQWSCRPRRYCSTCCLHCCRWLGLVVARCCRTVVVDTAAVAGTAPVVMGTALGVEGTVLAGEGRKAVVVGIGLGDTAAVEGGTGSPAVGVVVPLRSHHCQLHNRNNLVPPSLALDETNKGVMGREENDIPCNDKKSTLVEEAIRTQTHYNVMLVLQR